MSEDVHAPLWSRLCWFAGLWLGGVLSVTAAAGLLRWWLG